MHISHINVTTQVSEAPVLEHIDDVCARLWGGGGGREDSSASARYGTIGRSVSAPWSGPSPFALGGPTRDIKPPSDKGAPGITGTNEPLHHNSGWRREKRHGNQKANLGTKKAFDYSKNA